MRYISYNSNSTVFTSYQSPPRFIHKMIRKTTVEQDVAATLAIAADYEAGVDAYKRGDYATALREFQPLAEQGDADAQYYLGVMYERCLLYTSPSPRDRQKSRMPSSA